MTTSAKISTSLAIAAMMTSAASAAVITLFSDDFNRGTATALNGSTPTYVNPTYYAAGLTWTSSTQNKTTAGQPMDGHKNAYLAFTPVTGKQYLITAVAKVNSSFMTVGFGDAVGIADFNWWNQDVKPSTLAYISSPNGVGYGSHNSSGAWVSGDPVNTTFTADVSGYNTISWLLDTTLATWTATLSVNGSTIGTVNPSTSIDAVGIGRYGNDGAWQVSSFSVSIIPEPTAALLGSLGMLFLLRRRRN